MPGRTAREAFETFVGYLNETLSCITESPLVAYQETDNRYKVLYPKTVTVDSRSGDRFYMQITQVCTVAQREDGLYKVKTREYSYVFSDSKDASHHGVLSYHWHPHDFNVRDPHLHLRISQQLGYPEIERKIARAHFPTSRVCLEDFVVLLINYYDIQPVLHASTWKAIIRRNKGAFNNQATWFVKPK